MRKLQNFYGNIHINTITGKAEIGRLLNRWNGETRAQAVNESFKMPCFLMDQHYQVKVGVRKR